MRRFGLVFSASAIGLAALIGAALAQSVAERGRAAEQLAAQGKMIEAIDALDEAALALWAKLPLGFRRALWVKERATGFGIYAPRENAVFAAGEPMLIYAEPVGHGWRRDGELWRSDMIADVVFKSKEGKPLMTQAGFEKFQLASRVRNREYNTNFRYVLTGIPKGEYLAETTLRDQVSGTSGSFTLPFTIR